MKFFHSLKIRSKLFFLLALTIVSYSILTFVSLRGMNQINEALESQHNDHLLPLNIISMVRYRMAESARHAGLALQHDPTGNLASSHDHDVNTHLDVMKNNTIELTKLSEEFKTKHVVMDHCGGKEEGSVPESYCSSRTSGQPKTEKDAFDNWSEARGKLRDEGIYPIEKALEEKRYQDASSILLKKVNPLYAVASEKAKDLENLLIDVAKIEQEHAEKAEKSAVFLIITTGVISLSISMLFIFMVLRSITKDTTELLNVMNAVAVDKDLTVDITGSDSEIGKIKGALKSLILSLHDILMKVSASADAVSTNAMHVSAASQQIEMATQTQSNGTATIAASIEELTVSIHQINDNSDIVSKESIDSLERATNGVGLVNETVESIKKASESFSVVSEEIQKLKEKSDNIGKIVDTIKSIAEQTNLLALNAAIEAARAGDAGRGFAVVADEVRKLAETTSKATKEIATMITSVQSDVVNATQKMTESSSIVKDGVSLAQKAGVSLSEIQTSVRKVVENVSGIRDSLSEQKATANAVAQGMEEIAATSEETSQAVSETSRAANDLSERAVNLNEVVSVFKI